MNLTSIAITPFAQGIIKVDCDRDETTNALKTRSSMVVSARHHAVGEGSLSAPKLVEHPIQEHLMALEANKAADAIVEIPVKLFFNKSVNSIAIQYKAYDQETGAPVCAGDGKDAVRVTIAGDSTSTLANVPCPGPERCAFAQSEGNACRRQMKMTVQIDGQNDPLSVFEVRSSSINNFRALSSQLMLIERRFGGLRHVPLKLQMWKASNVASSFESFDLLRLAVNADSEEQAFKAANDARESAKQAGLCEDFDDVFSGEFPSTDPIGMLGDDFQMVSDFYEVSQPLRRRTEPLQSTVTGTQQPNEVSISTAGNLIADAVRRAGAGRSLETEQKGIDA